MRVTKKLLGLASLASVAIAPTAAMAAPANPASSLSIARSVRAGSVTTKKSGLAGAGGAAIFGGLLVAGIGAILIVDGVKNDDSDSN